MSVLNCRVEAGSNTSTVTLRVVGGEEKGSLESVTAPAHWRHFVAGQFCRCLPLCEAAQGRNCFVAVPAHTTNGLAAVLASVPFFS
jgi:hypothetical protein